MHFHTVDSKTTSLQKWPTQNEKKKKTAAAKLVKWLAKFLPIAFPCSLAVVSDLPKATSNDFKQCSGKTKSTILRRCTNTSPLQFSIFTYYNWPEINPECKTLHMPKKQWNERNLQHGSSTGPRDWILLKLQGEQNYKPLVAALVKGSQGCSTRVILCSMYNHDLSPERTVLWGKQKIWLLCEII